MLPPQCWSSCSPSSRGCSASWTTSTSATPPWRRRWPWPPSCRACSLSQVRRQHSAQSPSGPSVAPQGCWQEEAHSIAFNTLRDLANVLIHFGPSPPQPCLCSLCLSIPKALQIHTHNAHATHRYMPHTTLTRTPHSHIHLTCIAHP